MLHLSLHPSIPPSLRTLFLSLMVFVHLSAQTNAPFSCGTIDLIPTEYTALLAGVTGSPIISGSGSNSFQIPVWMTVVRQTNGDSQWTNQFFPLQLISDVNSFFNNGMTFVLCGLTYVDSDEWYILNTVKPPNAPSEWTALLAHINNLNSGIPKGYIDVIHVGGFDQDIGGIAGRPQNVSNRGSVVFSFPSAETVAHELGHYFTLSHTHSGGHLVLPGVPPQWAQYVDDPAIINNNPFTGFETGDLIPDTPADPGVDFCTQSSNCAIISNCTVIDPLGKTYHPDPTLLMSYYSGCRNRFSPQQNQRMIDFYLGHPNWSFLTNPFYAPACQNNFPNDFGLIRRNCDGIYLSDGATLAPHYTPSKNVLVPLKDALGSSCGSFTPITNINGFYPTYPCVYPAYSGTGLLSILPDKNYGNPINGITAFDLNRISDFILSIAPFTSPFQYIAADDDMDGNVSTADLNNIRKVFMNVPGATLVAGNWRYIPEYCFKDQNFADEFFDDDDPFTPGIQPNPFPAVWTNPDEPNTPTQRRYVSSGNILPNQDSWMDHVSINPNGAGLHDHVPWSFFGVKVGDVDCNANVNGFTAEDPDDELFTGTGHSIIGNSQIFILKIGVNENIVARSWQMGIEFAADTMEILEVLPGNSGENFTLENFGLSELENGMLKAINFSTTGRSTSLQGKDLFKLKVKALKPIDDVTKHFRLTNRVLEKIFYGDSGVEIESTGLTLEVSTATTPGFSSPVLGNNILGAQFVYDVMVYPVPFSSELMFDFSIPNDGVVGLSIFDNMGRLVSAKKEFLNKGRNTIRVSGNEMNSGLYWYLLETAEGFKRGKVFKG